MLTTYDPPNRVPEPASGDFPLRSRRYPRPNYPLLDAQLDAQVTQQLFPTDAQHPRNLVQQLTNRGVAPDVADSLIQCSTANRVMTAIKRFDRWGRSSTDPTAWFQEMLLDDTHHRNLSHFGQEFDYHHSKSGGNAHGSDNHADQRRACMT